MEPTSPNVGISTDNLFLSNIRGLNPWRGATMVAGMFALLGLGLGIFGTLGVLQPVVGISHTMSSLVGQLGATSFPVILGVGYGSAGVLTLLSIWSSRKVKGPSINTQPPETVTTDLKLKASQANLNTVQPKHQKTLSHGLDILFRIKGSFEANLLKNEYPIAADWIEQESVPEGQCWFTVAKADYAVFVVNDGKAHYIYAGPQAFITNMLLTAHYEVVEQVPL